MNYLQIVYQDSVQLFSSITNEKQRYTLIKKQIFFDIISFFLTKSKKSLSKLHDWNIIKYLCKILFDNYTIKANLIIEFNSFINIYFLIRFIFNGSMTVERDYFLR